MRVFDNKCGQMTLTKWNQEPLLQDGYATKRKHDRENDQRRRSEKARTVTKWRIDATDSRHLHPPEIVS